MIFDKKKLGGFDMKKSIVLVFSFIIIIGLIGCAPSDQLIQEALANTQTAMATNTNTPEPTSTNTPVPTLTPTPTSTPTEVPTLTPTPDVRVITIDSKEFLLAKSDLPIDAKYFLPNETWISPHHNSEVISGWGNEEGLDYLDKTGRIDGWWVVYKKGVNTVRAPEEIYHNIIQYKTAEGAFLTVTQYQISSRIPEFKIIDDNYPLGDKSVITMRKEMQPSGEYRVNIRIETAFRNYTSVVDGWGWEKEFDQTFVISVAETIIKKLEAAPLGNW
jgi:hypothetical protein